MWLALSLHAALVKAYSCIPRPRTECHLSQLEKAKISFKVEVFTHRAMTVASPSILSQPPSLFCFVQHEEDQPKQITPLRLLKFGKPELPLVISATFLSAICAFLNMSQNFFVGWLVDIVRFSDLSMRQDQLNWITFVLLAIYIADAMLALFSGVLYTIAASRCSCRLRSLVLRNMLRQDVAFFDTVRIGELLNRLSTDTEVIQSVVTSNLVGWFIPSVQVIIGFVICFW
jgi:ABC-type bacteriocin/lantibiotic exporter with double-glycine peptidase domain